MEPTQGVLGEAQQQPSDDDGVAAYEEAVELVQTKLYDENLADGIGEAIMTADDKVQAVADQALTLASLVDEATGGSVPDDMVLTLGLEILGEVAEIAEQVGAQLGGREIAAAARMFIAEAVKGMGGDAADIEQAMAAVGDDQVGAVLEEADASGG